MSTPSEQSPEPASVTDRLKHIAERASALSKRIAHNQRLLELLDEAKIRVSFETEYFSGKFDFGSEITGFVRERIRKRLAGELADARREAEELTDT